MSPVPILNARARATDPAPARLRPVAPTRPIVPISLCLAVCALLMAGCGSSDNGVAAKSAAQILAAAKSAAQSASSVHISANSGTGPGKLTLQASLSETQGQAHVSFLGIVFEAIRVGDTLYVKGNQAFDVQLERTIGVKMSSTAWLKGPATGTLAQTGAVANMKTEIPLVLGGSGALAKGSRTTVKQQPAIELKQALKLYTETIYVATTGKPYPLKLMKTGRETGQTEFTGWNDPVTVTPPAHAVDISQLQHLKKGH